MFRVIFGQFLLSCLFVSVVGVSTAVAVWADGPGGPTELKNTNAYCIASCKQKCSAAGWLDPVYDGVWCGTKTVGGGCDGCGTKWW